nr:hypothetical protein [Tanacetum cinerariifolium]
MKEVRKKSLKNFHKSYTSGFGSVAEKPPSVEKITPPVTSEGTGDKPGVPDATKDESTDNTNRSELDSEFDQQEDDDDDEDDDNDNDKSEEITQEQVIEDAHVTITKKNEVHVTSSSHSSDLASKFLDFLDIPPADAEIVSPLDVHVHHEVPRIHTSTLLAIPVSVIPEASPVYTNIPQSSQTFTSPPLQSTPTPLPTTETINIPPLILDFALVFRFNDRVIALEKDVAELKNDPLHTQVTALVDDHLDTRMGATREEFMNFLSASLTNRITKQVRNQLPQILPEEVSNFAPPVIEKMIQVSLNQVNLAKAESYLTAPEHQECYDGLVKSYNIDKDFISSYDVYSLKRCRDGKDKDKGPFTGSDRGLKKRKTRKDVEPTTSPKTKDSPSRSSKGTKSQPTSSRKFIHMEEPEFKEFDELMSTPIKFSSYILNGLKIENLTQEILLGPAFRLLKGTRSNYVEIEYDFEECYKDLLEKIDWENPEGDDYPFDLSKPLPLIMLRNQ